MGFGQPFDYRRRLPAHVFLGIDNGGAGEVHGGSCDATTGDFRTRQAINGGKSESSLNETGLGATVHW